MLSNTWGCIPILKIPTIQRLPKPMPASVNKATTCAGIIGFTQQQLPSSRRRSVKPHEIRRKIKLEPTWHLVAMPFKIKIRKLVWYPQSLPSLPLHHRSYPWPYARLQMIIHRFIRLIYRSALAGDKDCIVDAFEELNDKRAVDYSWHTVLIDAE